jgi:hypothetical protein
MTLPSTLACVKRLSQVEQQYIVSEKLFKDDVVILNNGRNDPIGEEKLVMVTAN